MSIAAATLLLLAFSGPTHVIVPEGGKLTIAPNVPDVRTTRVMTPQGNRLHVTFYEGGPTFEVTQLVFKLDRGGWAVLRP